MPETSASSEQGSVLDRHSTANAYCRNCGNATQQDAKACLSCGLPPLRGRSYCHKCKAATHPEAVICVKCGVGLEEPVAAQVIAERPSTVKTSSIDPALAAVLSVLLVGLGQMLLGQSIKGIAMLCAAIVLGLVTGCVATVIIIPLSGVDAYRIAEKIRRGQPIGEWEFF